MPARIAIAGREFNVEVAVTDHKDLRYHTIIGTDILRESGFPVDPWKGALDAA